MHTKTWHLHLNLFEEDDTTRAEAVLRTDAGTELRHVGTARRRPGDRDVPEIGDELAACRALSGLAHDLLDASITDIQANDPGATAPMSTSTERTAPTRSTHTFIRDFGRIGNDDVALVGGKNASLGEMYQHLSGAGVRIPGGFAITAEGYRHVLDEANAWPALAATFDGFDPSDVADLSIRAPTRGRSSTTQACRTIGQHPAHDARRPRCRAMARRPDHRSRRLTSGGDHHEGTDVPRPGTT